MALLQLKISQRQIVKIMGQEVITISQRTVSNVKRKIGCQRVSTKKIKFFRRRPVSTPSTVSEVLEKIDVEDPPTQRAIAKILRISQSTVSRTIESADFTFRKKR